MDNENRRNRVYVKLILAAVIFSLSAVLGSMASGRDLRKRVIEFDDELVEGLNKRPLDSLTQISEREARHAGDHLYRKRAGFRTETQSVLHEMRYTP